MHFLNEKSLQGIGPFSEISWGLQALNPKPLPPVLYAYVFDLDLRVRVKNAQVESNHTCFFYPVIPTGGIF